jgi:hypothetical protein
LTNLHIFTSTFIQDEKVFRKSRIFFKSAVYFVPIWNKNIQFLLLDKICLKSTEYFFVFWWALINSPQNNVENIFIS